MASLSAYDEEALKRIEKWRNPDRGAIINKVVDVARYAGKPIEWVSGQVTNAPLIGDVIKSAASGIFSLCNDAAQWSISHEYVFKDFRSSGHDVSKLEHIHTLELQKIEKMIGWVPTQYSGILAAEGIATGFAGAPGLIADIPSLIILSMRAIGVYATYYGFDVNYQEERLFALQVLSEASGVNDATKAAFMANLSKIAKQVAQKKTWEQLEKDALVRLIRRIAEAIGQKITKDKMAQVIPVVGSVVGGGFNYYYMSKVCKAANYMYMEKFIDRKRLRLDEQDLPPTVPA
jgi:EcsC protein family